MSILIASLTLLLQTIDMQAEREPSQPYDPFSGTSADARFRVRVDAVPDGALLIAEPSAGAPLVLLGEGGTPLPYRLASNAGRAGGTDDRIELFLVEADDGSGSVIVRLLVDAGPVVPPGGYDAAIDLRLVASDGTVLTELLAVPATVEVAARAQAILAGTSGAFDPQRSMGFVDFGTLETGEQRRLFATVRANTPSVVTILSENEGRLLLQDEPAAGDQPGTFLPYEIDLDGVVASLATPLTVTREPPLTTGGAAYPLTITIGDVAGLFAGTYRDHVTIDVRPQ